MLEDYCRNLLNEVKKVGGSQLEQLMYINYEISHWIERSSKRDCFDEKILHEIEANTKLLDAIFIKDLITYTCVVFNTLRSACQLIETLETESKKVSITIIIIIIINKCHLREEFAGINALNSVSKIRKIEEQLLDIICRLLLSRFENTAYFNIHEDIDTKRLGLFLNSRLDNFFFSPKKLLPCPVFRYLLTLFTARFANIVLRNVMACRFFQLFFNTGLGFRKP
ncbi:hypothetical protein RFI_26874 [Reticulomyxa filosa]|uniref:Uncharacterized protein n=1 Tax=Reticulomyxa filosa TaxID=46433 RepID=X6M9E5_RETFI|nr:hypothetical protein RFI_26874 [Reticulomyxa filosa]|eukprot:ETO10499.1 hypothetical protein RFI_26874 [Reticulomyxa filosa]